MTKRFGLKKQADSSKNLVYKINHFIFATYFTL